MTYKRPPLHPHGLMPQDIISPDDLRLLTRHYQATTSKGSLDEGLRSFSPEERAICATLYETLRGYGFYPAGIGEKGQMRWGIVLKSDIAMAFEKKRLETQDLEQMPIEELMRSTREQFTMAFLRAA